MSVFSPYMFAKRFKVIAAARMKMTCLLGCCVVLLISALMMEEVSRSETSVNFYDIARRDVPEDSHLHSSRPKTPASN
jgi:hypothetical protein